MCLASRQPSRRRFWKTEFRRGSAYAVPSASSPYASHVETKRAVNKRGQRSREEILETAARVMGERGYANTSIAVLSNEIGLAKSVIFHHFHSKGGLLSAVMERGLTDFFDAMREAHQSPPTDGTPRERMLWYLERSADVLASRQEFLRLHMLLILSADATEAEVTEAIEKIRVDGREHMNRMIRGAFEEKGPETAQAIADRLDHFGMTGIDGSFLAGQAEDGRSVHDDMELLADAIVLLGEQIAGRLRSS